MIIKEFTQKKGIFSSRKFTLKEDRLIIREKNLLKDKPMGDSFG